MILVIMWVVMFGLISKWNSKWKISIVEHVANSGEYQDTIITGKWNQKYPSTVDIWP